MKLRHEIVMPNADLPFRMFLFEGQKGSYSVAMHWHRSVELFYVMEGGLDFFIGEKHYPMKAGEFILVNSNELHAINAPIPNETIVLQIPVSAFAGFTREDGLITFHKSVEGQDAGLMEMMKGMYFTYQEKAYGCEMKVKSEFYQLLYLLVTEYRIENAGEERTRQNKNLNRLSMITGYIRENFQQEISLNGVAKHFGFAPTYLSRMFREYAGISYKTYLQNLRTEYGFKDLVETDLSISQIAMKNGFPNSKSFSESFRLHYGCLPSQYRKRLKG